MFNRAQIITTRRNAISETTKEAANANEEASEAATETAEDKEMNDDDDTDGDGDDDDNETTGVSILAWSAMVGVPVAVAFWNGGVRT